MSRLCLVCGLGWLLSLAPVAAQSGADAEPVRDNAAGMERIEVKVIMVKLECSGINRLEFPYLQGNSVYEVVTDTAKLLTCLHELRQKGLITRFSETKLIAVSGQPAWGLNGKQVAEAPKDFNRPSFSDPPGTIPTFIPFNYSVGVLAKILESGKIHIEAGCQMNNSHTSHGGRAAVQIEDGTTLLANGGSSTGERAITRKVPYLGDLPLVGKLFHTVTYQEYEEEFLMLVTPRRLNGKGGDDTTGKRQ